MVLTACLPSALIPAPSTHWSPQSMLTECPYSCSLSSLISQEHAYRVPLFLLLQLTDPPRACLPSAPIPAPSTHWSPQSMLTECPYSCSFNSLISPEHAYRVPLFLLLKLTDPPRACLLSAHVPAPSAHWSPQSMLTECPYPCSLSSLIPPRACLPSAPIPAPSAHSSLQSMLTECPCPCSFSSLIPPEHAYRVPLSLLLQLTDLPRACLPSAPVPAPSAHWSPKSMITECPCPCTLSSLIPPEHAYRMPLSLLLQLTDFPRAYLPNAPVPAPSAHWFPPSSGAPHHRRASEWPRHPRARDSPPRPPLCCGHSWLSVRGEGSQVDWMTGWNKSGQKGQNPNKIEIC